MTEVTMLRTGVLIAVIGALCALSPQISGAAECNITGTAGNDVLIGTPGDDIICARGGEDEIRGRGGDDTILGGGGSDTVLGGFGADDVSGGGGQDDVHGGPGGDDLHGSLGGDEIAGEGGSDEIFGGGGPDFLEGGDGDDVLQGGSGNDLLEGGAGVDNLDGGTGDSQCPAWNEEDSFSAGCQDVAAPNATDIGVSPDSVDTSGGSQEVVFTISFTDDRSGVASGALTITNPGGATELVFFDESDLTSGTRQDAILSVPFEVPFLAGLGTWRVSGLSIYDAVGNFREYDEVALSDAGLNASFEQAGSGDLTAPTLSDLSLSSDSIDVTDGPVDLIVTATILDAGAGVRQNHWTGSTAQLETPGWSQAIDANFVRDPGDADLYHATFHIPAYAPLGQWTLGRVVLVDEALNSATYGWGQLQAEDYPVHFNVTGLTDDTPPVLTDLEIAPNSIDTQSGPAYVTITGRATDDLSGVASPQTGYFGAPTVLSTLPPSFVDGGAPGGLPTFDASDPLDASFSITVLIPQFSELGEWTVVMALRDRAGNATYLSTEDIQALDLPSTFTNG
jgi:hypothetical protein